MPPLNDSYEVIGRILAKLILNGLRRQSLKAKDVIENIDVDDFPHFTDVMAWLLSEGLITVQAEYVDGSFAGAQLTAKGIAAIEKGTFNGSTSVRKTVEAKPGGLTSDNYGKIGSFIGGLIGGFAQSAQ